jgi:DNA polymerase-1
VTVSGQLADLAPGQPLAVVTVPAHGVALAWRGGTEAVATDEPAAVVDEIAALDPRWTWWSARTAAAPLVAAGVRPRICWDVGAVGRLLHGLRRDDAAAVWAASHGLPEPAPPPASLDLFDLDDDRGGPVRADGQLSREWIAGAPGHDLARAQRWAAVVLDLQERQAAELGRLADPRSQPRQPPLALLTAHAESAAAMLGVEMEHDGLPIDRDVAASLLRDAIGGPPADAVDERRQRQAREQEVLAHFPGADGVDLRSPTQVRALLARVGLDLPDTRSWRLAPHAAASPAIAALLAWRKSDRLATTYGWRWLDTFVAVDGRLRGSWSASDGGAGRMTATAGLHNLPAELRPAIRAEPGHLLVRADLGQVEPRVLAAISGDAALAVATHDADMYAPLAQRLGCDRATAKVAMLAAMYGQTSGAAADTMASMERAYPTAVAYLRNAEAAGRDHNDLRTYGGRLLRLSRLSSRSETPPPTDVTAAHGRFARNAAVQGPAAELFKAWAATVRDGLTAIGGQIVLCLHDELLVHVPSQRAPDATDLLHGALASTVSWWAAGSGVRFVAEVSAGGDWARAH